MHSIFELIQGLEPDERAALAFVVVGCTTGIVITTVVTMTSMIARVHRHRVEAELKRDMLDRGLTADEIATVISATAAPTDVSGKVVQNFGCRTSLKGVKAG